MYRFAIAEAEQSPDVAAALSANRFVNRHALEELLVRAQAAGVLGAGDPPRMMEQYFALLWGDLLVSRLLGAASIPTRAEIERRAAEATAAFLKLYSGGMSLSPANFHWMLPSAKQGDLQADRFGSKTEVAALRRDVCFAPINGHRQAVSACPKSATLGHRTKLPRINRHLLGAPGEPLFYFERGVGKKNLARRISTPMFSLNPPVAWKS